MFMLYVTKKHAPEYLHSFLSNSRASSINSLRTTISYFEANCLPTTPEKTGLVCRLIVLYCMHNSPQWPMSSRKLNDIPTLLFLYPF
jgi:hypothetical protein